MTWKSPMDVMPWVGLYIFVASLVCILAMAADVFHGFRQRKLWFPCRFFPMNAASLTLIGIALKLPVDLNDHKFDNADNLAKIISLVFLATMVANFLPSLGLMDDNELLMNILAFGIFIVTISVNIWIQVSTTTNALNSISMLLYIFPLPWPLSVALIVSASRRILQHRYKELHRLASNREEINFSGKRLRRYVKKYWMMVETGNPQFAVACSPVSSALGVVCCFFAFISFMTLIFISLYVTQYFHGNTDYKWSIRLIAIVQLIGVIVGSIAPIFRCLTATSYFNLSKKWSMNHLNVFRIEKHWIERLQLWKHSQVPSCIPSRHFKKVYDKMKNMILNFCIALQISVLVFCKTINLIPSSFLILFSYCKFKIFKEEPSASNGNQMSDMEDYIDYVVQIEAEATLSKKILRNAHNSITRLLHESEEKEPKSLINLLEKSTGFHGVVEFDSDQVPPLHNPEETQNCWCLVQGTLTAIAIALPNIPNSHAKEFLDSMREGLQIVRIIEESLNPEGDLVSARKAGRRVWTDVELYGMWLHIDLQKKARKGETSKQILQWLGDEAIKIVIHSTGSKDGSLDHLLRKFIAANSMYRISRTILLHCNEQEHWPEDEALFEFISTMISDILCACFTNLPRVITMKCHDDVIEKREESIRTAAQLLGKCKKILKILKARQLPNLDLDSMAYIDKWHALPKSQIPDGCSSSARASSNSTESFVVTMNRLW